jgi:hypothetical protein
MNLNPHPLVARLVEGTVIDLQDVKGRRSRIAISPCPTCPGSVWLALSGLVPIHLEGPETEAMIEALRKGVANPRLERHDGAPGVAMKDPHLVHRGICARGVWILLYRDADPGVAQFIASGAAPAFDQAMAQCISLFEEHRLRLADAVAHEWGLAQRTQASATA